MWKLTVGQIKNLVCYRKKQSFTFRQCSWGLRQLVKKPGFSLVLGQIKGIYEYLRKCQTILTALDHTKQITLICPVCTGLPDNSVYWPDPITIFCTVRRLNQTKIRQGSIFLSKSRRGANNDNSHNARSDYLQYPA